MGCKDPVNNDGGEELPGKWTTNATCWGAYTNQYPAGCSITVDNTKVTYKLTPSNMTNAEEKPSEGFTYWRYEFTQEDIFTGFKATASCSSAECGYGFVFCLNNYDAYVLLLNDDGFKVTKKIGDEVAKFCEWTSGDYIKAEPGENEVLVYTDTDGSIVIKINGHLAYTIRNPELKKGHIGFTTNVGKGDLDSGKPITITYKFEKFQY